MSAKNRLVVVDGTYELFRAYYGAPRKTSPDGREVGAAVGIARSMQSLRNSGEATHLAVAFDTVIESFRNQLLKSYKTGEGIDPDLFAQFPLAEEVVEALGIQVLRMIDFEADDALASLAEAGATEGIFERILLATPDKDLLQCVRGQHVVVWDRMRQKYYDVAGVVEKLGISPASVPDYLALVGDTADGIPGLPRFGARTAALILAKYEHLEHIPQKLEDWDPALVSSLRGAKTLAQTLREQKDDALLFRTVATLRRDLSLIQSWDELRPKDPDRKHLALLAADWDTAWLGEL